MNPYKEYIREFCLEHGYDVLEDRGLFFVRWRNQGAWQKMADACRREEDKKFYFFETELEAWKTAHEIVVEDLI